MGEMIISNATKSTYQKKYKCPYCDERYPRAKLHIHIQDKHEDMIPEGYTALRVAFNAINNKTEGHCIMCGGVTDWNEDKGRYERLCNDPKCHEAYKKMVAERTKKKYGTERLQTDPEYAEYVQRKALAGRKMHGEYKFADGGVVEYFGSYEKKFLQFMDRVMHCNSEDILAPAPSIKYQYEGKIHLYIPDFYYIPYNLIIEIKDGGSNPNNHPHRTGEDELKLRAKEEAIRQLNEFSYVRVVNNDFSQILSIMAVLKYNMAHRHKDPVIKVNESMLLETASTIDKNFKPKDRIELSSLKKVHITEAIIEKYKKQYPDLRHVRCKDIDTYKCDGYMWLDKENLVAQVGSCEYLDDGTKWIVSLDIMKDYKGHGLNKQILDFATKTMKCRYLSVDKNNKLAKIIYDQYGFKVYYEDDDLYYMTLEANPVKVNESVILESILINEKDIYYNKDKFDSGEINLCFITGLSGSGKSTMGRDMQSHGIEHYDMDDLQCIADHFTLENLKEYGDLIYSYFTGEGKKFYKTLKELEDDKVPESEYEDKLYPGFVHYAMKYAKAHKDRKFVLEGVWLYNKKWFTPEEFKDYAFYIKGTSMIISQIRGAKRDSKDAGSKFKQGLAFISCITKNWKWYIIDEGQVNKFRKYFENIMAKREIDESMAGAIGSAIPLTPNPIPYECDKDNYYIIQHTQNNVSNYSITKDPVQYTMYSVDPEEDGFYKVFKSNKSKISNKYTTFKIKDSQTAKELYDELANLESSNSNRFFFGETCNDYIYQRLTGGDRLVSNNQLYYDNRFERINSFNEDLQDIRESIISYIFDDPITKLEESVRELSNIVDSDEYALGSSISILNNHRILKEVNAEEYLKTHKCILNETNYYPRNKITPVFITLFRGTALRSYAIRWYTKTEWSHASMSFDSSMRAMYTFNSDPDIAANGISSGFTIEDIQKYQNINPNIKFKVYALFVTSEQKAIMQDAVQWYIENQDKTKYSMRVIFNIFFKRISDFGSDLKNYTEMVCSEFVYTILALANLKLQTTKDRTLVSPGDLDRAIDERMFNVYLGGIGLYNPKKIDTMCKKIIRTLPLDLYNNK